MGNQLNTISEIFKVLSNPTRLKIMILLSNEKRKCVKEISQSIKQKQSSTSCQLNKLRMKHLIEYKKENNKVFYNITEPKGKNIVKCISCIINESKESS